jgi:predicted PurR-regulated permease PerM
MLVETVTEAALAARPRASAALVVVATVATLAALYAGSEFFVPLSLGLVLAALLRPLVARLHRAGLPYPAGAALGVLGGLAALVLVFGALGRPVRGLAAELPRSVAAARQRLTRLGAPLERLTGGGAAAPAGAAPASAAPPDSGARPAGGASGGMGARLASLLGRAFSVTSTLLGDLVELLLLAFFVLADGDRWRARVTAAVRSPDVRARVLRAAGEMRGVVSRYLLVTAAINAAQGLVVGLALWLLHVPSPALWGALTFVLEFVPYLGGLVMVTLLLLVGLASTPGLAAFAPPAVYLAVTTLQNNLVSPWAYGRGLRLSPTAILVAVVFWYVVWGVAGAFLAVPILAALRVVVSHVERLAPMQPFLEE